jgi:hypothetical protein
MGDQNCASWQLNGYFVPFTSGGYNFKLTADDCAYLWVDDSSQGFGGAKSGQPTVSNYYAKADNTGTGATLTMTAYELYPFRIQFGNKCGGSNPW